MTRFHAKRSRPNCRFRLLRNELLERRELLTTVHILPDADSYGRTWLWIEGTGGPDTAIVSQYPAAPGPGWVSVETDSGPFLAPPVFHGMIFNGLSGDDQFVNNTSYPSIASGGPGDDTLTGGSACDRIVGEDGHDRLEGRGGDDYIGGDYGLYRGNDTINGGSGDDVLWGDQGDDVLRGGAGNDIILGGSENDRLFGDSGRDLLIGGPGEDSLTGGCEEDIMVGGWTGYDGNLKALKAILAEWTQPTPRDTRIGHLTHGGGLNGHFMLTMSSESDGRATVFDDGQRDEFLDDERSLCPAAVDWLLAYSRDGRSRPVR